MNRSFAQQKFLVWNMGCYLFCLLLLLPASWVKQHISLPAGLEIIGVEGTLWHGRIALLRWQNKTFRQVNWSVRWRSLLVGKIAAAIRIDDGDTLTGRAVVAYRQRWSVTGMEFQTSADWLVGHLPRTLPVVLTGRVRGEVRELTFTPQGCITLNGHARWQDGSIDSLWGQLKLGGSDWIFSCDDQQARIAIEQAADSVSSRTTLLLSIQGQYHIQSLLTPGRGFPPPLARLLKAGGQDMGNGIYNISASGRL
ncbi:Pectic enzymes secretion protein OUTN [Campylobacter jejuni]|nr:Pectic enzymes secretion protein OUTN [Campylobacter jejuni]